MNGSTEDVYCRECGEPLADHMSIEDVCRSAWELRAKMDAARAALMLIWPDGEKCQHQHARTAFEALK